MFLVHPWKVLHNLNFEVGKSIDNLHFEIGEIFNYLPFTTIVRKMLHHLHLDVGKRIHVLNLDVGEILYKLDLSMQRNALELARFQVVRMRFVGR